VNKDILNGCSRLVYKSRKLANHITNLRKRDDWLRPKVFMVEAGDASRAREPRCCTTVYRAYNHKHIFSLSSIKLISINMGAAPSTLPEKSVVHTLDERLRSMHVADNDYLFVEKHLGE
jgi:hypothetical protein